MNRAQLNLMIRAAEKKEFTAWMSGDRRGGVGRLGLDVLRELAGLIDHKTGRLDPAYATIAQRLGRSRSAIAEALRRLKEHGWLDWVRRVDRAPPGADQRWKQTSNAFGLRIPPMVKLMLGHWAMAPRPPEDAEDRALDRQRQVAQWEREQRRLDVDVDNPRLAAALARLNPTPDCCSSGA